MLLALNMPGSVDALSFAKLWVSVKSSAQRIAKHRYTKPVAVGMAVLGVVGTACYLIKKDFDRTKAEHKMLSRA